MAGIFISYARKDINSAQKLEELLLQKDIRVWRDQDSIYAGEQWPKAIGQAIEKEKIFLLLWSKHSAVSHFVEFEWNTALALKKTIVPVFLDNTPLPAALRAINGVSLEDTDKAIKKILDSMSASPPSDQQQNRRVIDNLSQIKEKSIETVLDRVKTTYQQHGWQVYGNVYQVSGEHIHITADQQPKKWWEKWLAKVTFLIVLLTLLIFVKVVIVPYGSTKPLDHASIEKQIAQLSDEVAKMRKESSQPKSVDFSFYLKEWADQYGFTPDQVKTQFDQWAEEVKDSDNFRTLGLRAFYLKNFTRAAEIFTRAALQGEQRRMQEDLATFENWKMAGNSYYAGYKFREALETYRKAEKIATFEKYPRQWGEIRILLGNTLSELGRRVKGDESKSLLSSAVSSYRQALKLYTRHDAPRDWARTQNNLGNALSQQGIRTGGQEGADLLAQAVQAYQKALEIRTFEYLPTDWAQTQNNLAKLYETRENWSAAIKHYRNVYKIYPADAANKLALLLHDRVFRFKEALEMTLYLAKQKDAPDVNILLQLVENYFTTGFYNEGNRFIQKLRAALKDHSYSNFLIISKIFEISNCVGLDDTGKAAELLESLIKQVEKQPTDFKLGWNFIGTKYFIRTHKAIEPHREWLLSLFTALEKTGRDSIVSELKKLRPRERQSP
ncbi:MAG: toll/interleukin-1 receptor domain-containing protein [Candidatus Aminicenantes bacterium]|jgi:tetratricopeptide (TPR) repeat protein